MSPEGRKLKEQLCSTGARNWEAVTAHFRKNPGEIQDRWKPAPCLFPPEPQETRELTNFKVRQKDAYHRNWTLTSDSLETKELLPQVYFPKSMPNETT